MLSIKICYVMSIIDLKPIKCGGRKYNTYNVLKVCKNIHFSKYCIKPSQNFYIIIGNFDNISYIIPAAVQGHS